MNAYTPNGNPFLTEPADSDMVEANTKNNWLHPNDDMDDFINVEDLLTYHFWSKR